MAIIRVVNLPPDRAELALQGSLPHVGTAPSVAQATWSPGQGVRNGGPPTWYEGGSYVLSLEVHSA